MGGVVSLNLKVAVEAPSNIALIKYMGKEDHQRNVASNPSISYTLPHLKTKVSIAVTQAKDVVWKPDEKASYPLELSESGKNKFIAHWDRCRQRMAPRFQQGVVIESGNNFPSDCGLASSASSFAALTMAAHRLFSELDVLDKEWSQEELAQLSREGSGSSGRSFFEPWVLWSGDVVQPLETPLWTELLHTAVVVDHGKKKISSSDAHRRIITSALFEGRRKRATDRSEKLQKLLKQNQSWSLMYECVWSEFWDMHVLFETSSPPFHYITPKSLLALRFFQEDWEKRGDGPLVTMDAGPNIHLLYRKEQEGLQREHIQKLEAMDFFVISPGSSW